VGDGGCTVGVLERGIAGGGNRGRGQMAIIWRIMMGFDCGSIFGRVNGLMIHYVRRVIVKIAHQKIVRGVDEMPGVVSWSRVHLLVLHI
jgi:hypothetical protein